MAKTTTRKKTSTQNKTSTRAGSKSTASKPTKMELERNYKIKYELKMISLAAVTIFIMISLYTKAVGVVGHTITNTILGLFSYVGYGLPIVFFIVVFVFLNPNFRPARLRVGSAMLLIVIGLLLLSTLIAYDGIERDKLVLRDDYASIEGLKYAYSLGMSLDGGGVFGDVLSIATIKLIGLVGTYILIIVTFLVGFIIFTKISMQDLWELKKKTGIERKQIKDQDREIEATILQSKLDIKAAADSGAINKKSLFKHGDVESDPGFLSDLENMRKMNKKKDVKIFDYDSYDNDQTTDLSKVKAESMKAPIGEPIKPPVFKPFKPETDPLSDGTIDFFDHNDKKSERTADKAMGEKTGTMKAVIDKNGSEKLKESDIDPQTRQLVHDEIRQNTQKVVSVYQLPPLELLNAEVNTQLTEDKSEYIEMAKLLEETLNNFNVDAKVVSVKRGPSITMFEVQPSPGVKVSKIVGLSEDIALNLATSHVRIAPIPGKVAIGIEVPNKVTSMVTIREVITSPEFKKSKSKLTIGLGKDISGNAIIGDLSNMPHLLIAGATGSGKSVCVNTIISSILFNARPDEVKFLMIDPKVVELSNYNGIPHLILPVVTDPKKASIALNWAVNEMTRRYKMFAEQVVRDMKSYNKKAEINGLEMLPQIVVIIDELADLMMVAPNVVEDAICRLAQMARAAGIHLIVATQRPSVDVITGLIKANIPSRIAFSVSSSIDSRTIIDMGGAEKLLGKGDMLYYPIGASKPKRAQGAFMSDEEVEALVGYIKNQDHEIHYNEEILDEVQTMGVNNMDDVDEYLEDAIAFVVESGQASASLMQRRFRVGYNRAARLVDSMEERGIIGPSRGSKPREVLLSTDELRALSGLEAFEMEYSSEDNDPEIDHEDY